MFHWWLRYLPCLKLKSLKYILGYLRNSALMLISSDACWFPLQMLILWGQFLEKADPQQEYWRDIIILLCFFVGINSHIWYWLSISSITAVIPEAWSRWFKITGITLLLVWQEGLHTTFVFVEFKLFIFASDKMS